MNIHTVTLPNGIEAKRTSQNRTYTHVVTAEYLKGTWAFVNGHGCVFTPDADGGTKWAAVSWSSREDLAQKAALQLNGRDLLVVRVLPCRMVTKTPADKVNVRTHTSGGLTISAAGKPLGRIWMNEAGMTASAYNPDGTVTRLPITAKTAGAYMILKAHNRAQAEIDQVLAKLEGGR